MSIQDSSPPLAWESTGTIFQKSLGEARMTTRFEVWKSTLDIAGKSLHKFALKWLLFMQQVLFFLLCTVYAEPRSRTLPRL